MNENYSIALKEFTQITKTQQIRIPDDIKDVTKKLNILGGLLTASDWARSAIVRAWVTKLKPGPKDCTTSRTIFGIREFAELGIQGLSTTDAVRHYYNAWELTKLPSPDKGNIIDLPQIPFPSWEGSSNILVSKHTGEQENYTPIQIIQWVKEVLGNIDLDPASTDFAQKIVQADEYFTKEDDGLSKSWHGNVFLNPPYQMPKIREFTDKLINELPNLKAAILLTNNNTDTLWFHKCAENSELICFTKGRINFYKTDKDKTYPTNGQSFFYFGDDKSKFLEIFSQCGLIVRVEK